MFRTQPRTSTGMRFALAAALAASCSAALLSSCSAEYSAEPATRPPAVIVDGDAIAEQDITDAISCFRLYAGYADDADWAEYLGAAGTTASQLRSDMIDARIDATLIKHDAGELGISVGEDDVREYMTSREPDSDAVIDDAYARGLGFADLASYERYAEAELWLTALSDHFAEVYRSDDAELLDLVRSYADRIEGAKRISVVSVPVEAAADGDGDMAKEAWEAAAGLTLGELDDIRSRLETGEISWEDAIAEVTERHPDSADYQGDIGWVSMLGIPEDHIEAIAAAGVGGMTEPLVYDDVAYAMIYRVDGEYHLPEGFVEGDDAALGSIDSIPSEFADLIRSMADGMGAQEAGEEWLSAKRDAADISVSDMPSGLPYDVEPVYPEYTGESGADAAAAVPEAEAGPDGDGAPAEDLEDGNGASTGTADAAGEAAAEEAQDPSEGGGRIRLAA